MPEVKMAVSFLFPEAPVHDSADYLRSMRPCDDMTLDDLANLRFECSCHGARGQHSCGCRLAGEG
jgi:hypothetical protein